MENLFCYDFGDLVNFSGQDNSSIWNSYILIDNVPIVDELILEYYDNVRLRSVFIKFLTGLKRDNN